MLLTCTHTLSGPTLILKCCGRYDKVRLMFKIVRKQTIKLKKKRQNKKKTNHKIPPTNQNLKALTLVDKACMLSDDDKGFGALLVPLMLHCQVAGTILCPNGD